MRPSVLTADIEGGEHTLVRITHCATCRAVVMEVHDAMLGPARTAEVQDRLAALGFRRAHRPEATHLCLRDPPA